MTLPSVAIVVVTFNSEAVLADLIDSLPGGVGAEINSHLVVADNQSADESVHRVQELAPGCRVVEMGRNAGYAAGVNAAIAAAGDHDAYLVLNPDVRLGKGCVPVLLAALREAGVGIAVPRLTDAKGDLILSMRRAPSILRALGDAVLGAERAGRWSPSGEIVSDRRAYARSALTDWAEGSTQLVSRACWQRCGPWDETFFLYSEETDFGLRARDAGFATKYVPEAEAVHLEGGSATSPRLWALVQVNRVRLYRRRHGLLRTSVFWGVTVLREASRSLLGKKTSRAALQALVSPRRFRRRPGPDWLAAD